MLTLSHAFNRRISEHLAAQSAVTVVAAEASCASVVARLREQGTTAAVICNAARQPVGIVTERDVCRRMAYCVAGDTAIERVMTAPVASIAADDYLHHALARMRRDAIRHLPVVDSSGQLAGLLELEQLLASVSGQTVAFIDQLGGGGELADLIAAKKSQRDMATALLADEIPASDIQRLLSQLNNQLYQEALRLALARMSSAGLRPAPAVFDVIVMGSGGRGESFLYPDQDNGFIIADYPATEQARIDDWFAELATIMTQLLDQIGLPLCRGDVMATNPQWRMSLSRWRDQVGGWIRKSEGNALRMCDIFFDFSCVFGDGQLTQQLRDYVTQNAARPIFLREMFKVDEQHDVALGLFGWLLRDRQ